MTSYVFQSVVSARTLVEQQKILEVIFVELLPVGLSVDFNHFPHYMKYIYIII